MGRMRRHHTSGPLLGRTAEYATIALSDDTGKEDITSNEVVVLCLAILRLLQQSPSTAPLPARSSADSLAHLVASMAGTEVNTGRLHVALLALESIGAVRRIGYGHSALYAASTSCNSSSQMLRQQDAAANDNGQVASQAWPSAAARAEQSSWPQQAFCITTRNAEVKIPLLCISNMQKPGTRQKGEQKSRAK
ncbi:hypothetical protein CVIRNUC_002481 [Coccomyxa viridis]|uniref:Uncharacterized protein n=1 Tax=Coccomyxa viridis TaxID=1274662 RepID=A0AAV1HVU7_9CHLO|nr:hypothetical protein CVIRNUC_002481 [Coccomyxa viridis]